MAARVGITAVASSGQETAGAAVAERLSGWRKGLSSPSSGPARSRRAAALRPAAASARAGKTASSSSSSCDIRAVARVSWNNPGAGDSRTSIPRQKLRTNSSSNARCAAHRRSSGLHHDCGRSTLRHHECGHGDQLWGRSRTSERDDVARRKRATWAVATARSLLKAGAAAESVAPQLEELQLTLPEYDPTLSVSLDLLVVGSGPAGLAVAQLVSACGLRVCCVDPSPKSIWPNNYGVWVDEFEAMDLLDCLDYTWPRAVVYLDDGADKVKDLSRPYGRVNRVRLKGKMMEKCIQNGVTFFKDKVDGVEHNDEGSTVLCRNGVQIRAKVVLDATGHSRRLVKYDEPFDPGYQAAYGILAEVDRHPFDLDAMLFMDWRDSHLARDPTMRLRNKKLPTFLYAMPFSKNRIFLEETSLVAKPAVPFPELKARMELRLQHLGVTVKKIEEEEYCLIPMGGVLPSIPQRVLGIGGTAGMVHPSTGYMVARTLSAAPDLAQAVISLLAPKRAGVVLSSSAYLSSPFSYTAGSSSSFSLPQTTDSQHEELELSSDRLAELVWQAIWPVNRKRQRECFCFGMEILLQLNLTSTRSFFDAFFSLTPYYWHGFLSSRLYTKELLIFALQLFCCASIPMRLEIMVRGFPALVNLISKVLTMKK